MIFHPELVEKVLAGEKTQTRRRMSHNPRSPWWARECGVRVGQTRALQPGRAKHAVARVRILEVRREKVGVITDADARAEGFGSAAAFLAYWKVMHGGLDLTETVWAITFELIV